MCEHTSHCWVATDLVGAGTDTQQQVSLSLFTMVTIRKQKKENKLLTGTNLFVCLLVLQLIAIVFLFGGGNSSSSSSQLPVQAAEGVHGRLQNSKERRGIKRKQGDNEEPLQTKGNAEEEAVEGQDDDDDNNNNNNNNAHEASGGTHTTPTGYFADYQWERENPSFRQESVSDWHQSQERADQVKKGVRSCQYLSDDHRRLFHNHCQPMSQPELVAYNSHAFPRYWCGKTIPPHQAVLVSQACDEPVRLFDTKDKAAPRLDGQNTPPIVIKGEKDGPPASSLQDVPCNVPCKEETKFKTNQRYIDGTDWKITKTMDDPIKRVDAKVERVAYRTNEYYSSTSFESSVPLSYFSFDKYDIFSPPVDWEKVQPTGSYLIDGQCVAQTLHRNRWEDAVHNQAPVASYGSCAHNTDLPQGKSLRNPQDRIDLMAQHRFNLAFEFGDAKDHITPVVWEAFVSGSLPVVIGASNIGQHFPPKSYIGKENCQKWDDLGKVVKEVVQDRQKWESYHKWRTDPEAKRSFEERYNFTRTSASCRLCRWAHAKKHGHGWNHRQQEVRETAIPRAVCMDPQTQLVTSPFRESWHTYSSTTRQYKTVVTAPQFSTDCQGHSTLEASIGTRTRLVQAHDNVMDIVVSAEQLEKAQLDDDDDKLVLRLALPVRNTDGAHFANAHTLVPTARGALASSVALQDTKSKVTVLASWETELTSPSEGVVEVVVQHKNEPLHHGKDDIRRIRVIVEDMVELYDKVTEYWPTSFGILMIQDFVDPLELFYVE